VPAAQVADRAVEADDDADGVALPAGNGKTLKIASMTCSIINMYGFFSRMPIVFVKNFGKVHPLTAVYFLYSSSITPKGKVNLAGGHKLVSLSATLITFLLLTPI
jgi:hypothetical protein